MSGSDNQDTRGTSSQGGGSPFVLGGSGGGLSRSKVSEERLREAHLLLQCASLMPECDLAEDLRHAAADILKPYQSSGK